MFGQDLFHAAQKTKGLDDPEYRNAKALALRLAGPEGIDRLLRTWPRVSRRPAANPAQDSPFLIRTSPTPRSSSRFDLVLSSHRAQHTLVTSRAAVIFKLRYFVLSQSRVLTNQPTIASWGWATSYTTPVRETQLLARETEAQSRVRAGEASGDRHIPAVLRRSACRSSSSVCSHNMPLGVALPVP